MNIGDHVTNAHHARRLELMTERTGTITAISKDGLIQLDGAGPWYGPSWFKPAPGPGLAPTISR